MFNEQIKNRRICCENNKITISILSVFLLIAVLLSSCGYDVTEQQKGYAENIYQLAKNAEVIYSGKSDSEYKLVDISLERYNKNYYLVLFYLGNSSWEKRGRSGNGDVFLTSGTYRFYKIIEGKPYSNPEKRAPFNMKTEGAFIDKVTWKSSAEKAFMLRDLYKIAQYL